MPAEIQKHLSPESRLALGGLIAAAVLFLTVSASVAMGIFLAYGAISVVLYSFSRQATPRPRPALVASESHASGD